MRHADDAPRNAAAVVPSKGATALMHKRDLGVDGERVDPRHMILQRRGHCREQLGLVEQLHREAVLEAELDETLILILDLRVLNVRGIPVGDVEVRHCEYSRLPYEVMTRECLCELEEGGVEHLAICARSDLEGDEHALVDDRTIRQIVGKPVDECTAVSAGCALHGSTLHEVLIIIDASRFGDAFVEAGDVILVGEPELREPVELCVVLDRVLDPGERRPVIPTIRMKVVLVVARETFEPADRGPVHVLPVRAHHLDIGALAQRDRCNRSVQGVVITIGKVDEARHCRRHAPNDATRASLRQSRSRYRERGRLALLRGRQPR